jgi:hypothetical protein
VSRLKLKQMARDLDRDLWLMVPAHARKQRIEVALLMAHKIGLAEGHAIGVGHGKVHGEHAWRTAVEEALGVEYDYENHTPAWAREVVRNVREIGNKR